MYVFVNMKICFYRGMLLPYSRVAGSICCPPTIVRITGTIGSLWSLIVEPSKQRLGHEGRHILVLFIYSHLRPSHHGPHVVQLILVSPPPSTPVLSA